MFLISTRNFPPEVGGIQNLMEGLSNALLKHEQITTTLSKAKELRPYVVKIIKSLFLDVK